jgi:hypothetical protein
MLDLKYLEGALSGIAEVGKGEVTFDFNGTSLTMKALLPSEEVEVQKYASVVLEDVGGEEDAGSTATMEYLDRFKLALISNSIIAIGGDDLRDEGFIATGEKLPNGREVMIPRWEAIRKVAEKWSRPSLTLLFKKYSELIDKIESQAESAVDFDPVDLDTEIERLESRLAELHARKEEIKKEQEPKGINKMVGAMSGAMSNLDEAAMGIEGTTFEGVGDPPQEEDEGNPPLDRDQETPRPSVRASSIPQDITSQPSSTPQNAPEPEPEPEPDEVAEADLAEAEADENERAEEADRVLNTIEEGSFVDPENKNETQAILQAENERLARSRSQRRPPHLDALQASKETAQVGSIDGVDAFRIGDQAEEITKPQPSSQVADDDVNSKQDGTRNPRFTPPRRR